MGSPMHLLCSHRANHELNQIIASTLYGKVLDEETRTGLSLKEYLLEYWKPLGHTITRPLPGVSWAPNRPDILGREQDDQVLHKIVANGSGLPSKDVWEELWGLVFSSLHKYCL